MSSLLSLPTEILTEICLLLPFPRDTVHLASACRSLRDRLTVQNNYLWFTLLSTLPISHHRSYSLHLNPSMIPKPKCAVRGKFDLRVNYHAQALAILRGTTQGCFDCFNILQGSLREVRIGGVFYRTYCRSCYELHFEQTSKFLTVWPEIIIPPSLIGGQANTSYNTIHHSDAIFLIRDQLSPHARSSKGRFLSRWNHMLNLWMEHLSVNEQTLWARADRRVLSGAEMEPIITKMVSIYENDGVFRKYWPLGSGAALKGYLEDCALDFIPTLSAISIRLIRSRTEIITNIGLRLWRIRDIMLAADDAHDEGNPWEDGGRENYLAEICMEHLTGMLRIQPASVLLTTWMFSYLIRRMGSEISDSKYKPYYCSFCKEEKLQEGSDEGEGGNPHIDFKKSQPLPDIPGLALHILDRHGERFDEAWVTGGAVVKVMAPGKEQIPFYKAVRFLDD
ncbi:hypothetical protein TWF718_009317 [Orbilia javanica]|uniref:F-box domain-containing protein n=1 Tax=Orbilia javanica TaxID=47235 RepID=A0AAN8MRI3_9PEZI